MVDYVVYAAPADEAITRAMVTMLQPVTGIRLMVPLDAPPQLKVGLDIPLFAIWSEDAAKMGYGPVFAQLLGANPQRAVVVALMGTPLAPELAALKTLVIKTVSDAAKDTAALGAALKAARFGISRAAGGGASAGGGGEKSGLSPTVLALGGLAFVAVLVIGALASLSISSSALAPVSASNPSSPAPAAVADDETKAGDLAVVQQASEGGVKSAPAAALRPTSSDDLAPKPVSEAKQEAIAREPMAPPVAPPVAPPAPEALPENPEQP